LHFASSFFKISGLLHTFDLLDDEFPMAYNEILAQRIREALPAPSKVEEKKMMGGLTFMVNGKMCVGILRDDLMARLDPEVYETALTKKGCREMDFTGKPMKGFVFISPEGTKRKADLDYWIGLALDFNKRAKASKKRKKK
jgi:TfoX/Sxy family transcriptional regulator of competence genes